MSDFIPYEETVPSKIIKISFLIESNLPNLFNEYGEPVPGFADEPVIEIIAEASVVDQNNKFLRSYRGNIDRLIALGLVTETQRTTMENFIETFRNNIEGIILPPQA